MAFQCHKCGAELHDEDLECPLCNYGDPDNLLAQASRLWLKGRKDLALEAMTTATRLDSNRADIWYAKAKYECQRGLLTDAITSLEVASSFDGLYVTLAAFNDSEFKPLRADPRFRKLVNWRKDELDHLAKRHVPIPLQKPKLKRCRECGAELGQDSKFCPSCNAYQP